MEFIRRGSRNCKQRRTRHECGSRNCDHRRNFGKRQRFRDFDRDSRGLDRDFRDPGDPLRCRGQHPAIHRDRELQQRQHAEPYQHSQVDFVRDDDSDRKQRRIGDRCRTRNHHHHRQVRLDHGFRDLDGYGRGLDLAFRDSGERFGRGWIYSAVHGYGNLQQRQHAKSHQLGEVDFIRDWDRDHQQRRPCHQRGFGNCDRHGNFGKHQRLRNVDRYRRGLDCDFRDSGDALRCGRQHPAVHGYRELQQRQHAKSHQLGKLELVSDYDCEN